MKSAILLLLASSPACAHAILVESTPAVHGVVAPGPATVTLRFNSRIDRERSRVTLIAADKTQARLAVTASGAADVMTAPATVQPGAYVVRWQVLAVDGHITRGDVPFTVRAP